jgi:hypothetical protein
MVRLCLHKFESRWNSPIPKLPFYLDGLPRLDHWQKHIREAHGLTCKEIKTIQREGMPTRVLRRAVWITENPRKKNSVGVKIGVILSSKQVIPTFSLLACVTLYAIDYKGLSKETTKQ